MPTNDDLFQPHYSFLRKYGFKRETTRMARNSSQSPFLSKLPSEIRNMIYTELFHKTTIYIPDMHSDEATTGDADNAKSIAKLRAANQNALAVSLTCLQIHRETYMLDVAMSNFIIAPFTLIVSYRIFEVRAKITRMTVCARGCLVVYSMKLLCPGVNMRISLLETIVEPIIKDHPALCHLTLRIGEDDEVEECEFMKPQRLTAGKTLVKVERGEVVEGLDAFA